jgi:predicted TIM-barrel fold metal-dependent hydrolase
MHQIKKAGVLHTAGAQIGKCSCCAIPSQAPSQSRSRRQFLAGGAALAASMAMPQLALSANAKPRVIDVHHHFEPSYKNNGGAAWTIDMALEQLDRNGVDTAIGFAGPIFDKEIEAGRKKAREFNEWSTKICVDHPGRFGLFASLPMNDVEGSLAEIAYAFDVLKADGIGLVTSYDDAWLGDPKFEPIFQELNRRKAVVFVHPLQAQCCTPATLSYEKAPISAAWVEYPTNTARTIMSLWGSAVTLRVPDIKFIFSHGGGVMPLLLGRIDGFSDWFAVGPEKLKALFPRGIYAEFSKFYFECAQAYAPEAFDLIRKLVPSSHLLFGTDFSYFPIKHSMDQLAALKLPAGLNRMVKGANAAALLPRWRT